MRQVLGVEGVAARNQCRRDDQGVPMRNLPLGLDFHRFLDLPGFQRHNVAAGDKVSGKFVSGRDIHAKLVPADVQEFTDDLHADGRLLLKPVLCDGNPGVVFRKRVDDVGVSEYRHGRRVLPCRSSARHTARDTFGTVRD